MSYLVEGWQRQFRSAAARVAIDAGAHAGYMRDSPVPQDFTLEHLQQAVGEWTALETSPYPHLPVGAALCYFGETAPPGFGWADGQSRFPQESWVAEALRGRPVPNLNQDNLLVGGTATAAEVGQLQTPAALQLPEITVDAGRLTPINGIQEHEVRLNNLVQIRSVLLTTRSPSSGGFTGGMGSFPIHRDTELSALREVALDVSSVDWSRTGHPNCGEENANGMTRCGRTAGKATARRIHLSHTVPMPVATGIAGSLPLGEVVPLRENAPEHIACRWIVRMR